MADRIARINATGTVNVARAFLARAANGDALVDVASTAGHSIPRILIPLRAFRLAEYAISKNVVHWYSVPLRPSSVSGERGSFPFPGNLDKLAAIKRFGELEEVAAAIAFCASEAPCYLTGCRRPPWPAEQPGGGPDLAPGGAESTVQCGLQRVARTRG